MCERGRRELDREGDEESLAESSAVETRFPSTSMSGKRADRARPSFFFEFRFSTKTSACSAFLRFFLIASVRHTVLA
jgi:hypothetical protein